MMSAVGATEKHLRFTMLASGAATGSSRPSIGAVVGVVGWIAVAPRMERRPAIGSTRSTCRGGSSSSRMVLAVVDRHRRGVVAGSDGVADPDRPRPVGTPTPRPGAAPSLGAARSTASSSGRRVLRSAAARTDAERRDRTSS